MNMKKINKECRIRLQSLSEDMYNEYVSCIDTFILDTVLCINQPYNLECAL